MASKFLCNVPKQKAPVYLWLDTKTEVVVFNDGKNWRAFQAICPHMGAQLSVDRSHQEIRCPWHPLRFSIKDGKSNHNKYRCIREFQIIREGDRLVLDE